MNPGPAAGSINTAGTTDGTVDLNLRNVQATRDETDDFWDGTARDYGTGAVIYRPGYNVYANAPDNVTIENSLVYSQFDGTALLAADQRIVDGREISLVALDGTLSQSQVSQFTVDTTAVSASTTKIPVQDTGSNIEIDVSTRLSEKKLVGDVLAGQIDDSAQGGGPGLEGDDECSEIDPDPTNDNERYISGCTFTPGSPFNTLTLTFESGETYTLKLAKVGVGSGYSSTSAAYITEVKGEGASVAESGTLNVVVEVRDKFNNPVTGKQVRLTLPDSGDGDLEAPGQDTVTRRTNDDGEVTVTYIAPSTITSSPRNVEIQATYDIAAGFDTESQPDDALIRLQAINGSQINRTQPLINPTNLALQSALIRDDSSQGEKCPGNVACQVDVTLKDSNTNGQDVVIDQIRYAFYSTDAAGTSPINAKGQVQFVEGSTTLEFAGTYKDVDVTVPDGSTEELTFKFRDDTGTPTEVDGGDFFVVSFVIDGERSTYFVPPVNDP